MKRTLMLVLVGCLLAAAALSAQAPEKRYALVIGNGEYKDLGSLANPVNDAADMAKAFKGVGFEVVLLTNASRKQMNQALNDFHDRLAADAGSAGVFWYAGHGVQTGDGNFLIPIGAEIKREADLEDEAVSVSKLMKLLDDARNKLNLVVLDACRNNPIVSSGRSGTRGLKPVASAPAESVIMYSTGAGQVANDGSGRNSPFAQAFLKYLAQPGDITATIKAVTAETKRLTNGGQIPYVYSSLTLDFAMSRAGVDKPAPSPQPTPESDWGEVTVSPGSMTVSVASAGTVTFNGKTKQLPAGASASLSNIAPGDYPVSVAYADGQSESRTVRIEAGKAAAVSFAYQPASTGEIVVVNAAKASLKVGGKSYSLPEAGRWSIKDQTTGSQTVTLDYDDGKTESQAVTVPAGGSVEASFKYQPGAVAPAPAGGNAGTQVAGQNFSNSLGATLVWVPGGSFTMGDTAGGGSSDETKHKVTLSGFYMGQTEVTQAQWQKVMGSNPSIFNNGSDAAKRPVEKVSWFDAVEFCNKLSQLEGKSPAYSIDIDGTKVTLNQGATGYRLPTEAQWEYAGKGGASTPVQTVKYAGSANLDEVAWTSSNSGKTTHPVAEKKPNVLGLYDLTGNVWEWCQDWYGNYGTTAQSDPAGAASGSDRVIRGGGWLNDASGARVSLRGYNTPGIRYGHVGFRLVLPAR